MKFQELRALAAIVDAGSIRAAARMLDVSTASVTTSIHQLEEELAVSLMQRTSTGVTLTAHGQVMLTHARLILGQIERAREEIETMSEPPRGRLACALSPWLGRNFLPETIVRFQKMLPKVELEIIEGHMPLAAPRLRDGTISFYVGREVGVASIEFNFSLLFTVKCGVVVRQDHPCVAKQSLADLLDFDWIVGTRPAIALFSRYGLPAPRRLHTFASLISVIAVLQRTDMICIFPRPLIETCSREDGLCGIPVREPIGDQRYGIFSRAGYPLGAAASCFVDCLIETIREGVENGSAEIRQTLRLADRPV